ncbi:MAG TPA: hypothetical protein VF334_21585 [Polyangia bacterium]
MREALRAMFPQGLLPTAAPDYFKVEANGIVETPTLAEQASSVEPERNLPTVRLPDTIRIPVATSARDVGLRCVSVENRSRTIRHDACFGLWASHHALATRRGS